MAPRIRQVDRARSQLGVEVAERWRGGGEEREASMAMAPSAEGILVANAGNIAVIPQ